MSTVNAGRTRHVGWSLREEGGVLSQDVHVCAHVCTCVWGRVGDERRDRCFRNGRL